MSFFSRRLLPRKDEPTRTEERPSSKTSRRSESAAIATNTGESSGQSSSSRAVQRRRKEPVDGCSPHDVHCVAFLIDGEHVVGGDKGGKIRFWRVVDGSEAGAPMDAWDDVRSIAVSRDGRWIVSGTMSGLVQLWNAETRKKAREIRGHRKLVWAVDISADVTKIASGSDDLTVCVWSLSTGELLLGPWEHDSDAVAAAKFSPDGRLVATASNWHSVRVYDEGGRRLFTVPIRPAWYRNGCLAWSNNGKQLFVLASDGYIHSLDAFTGTTLTKWIIHSITDIRCIALASDGTLLAAAAGRSVSLWDIATRQQVGPLVELDHLQIALCLAVSDDYDLAAAGDTSVVSICNLGDILPPSYTQGSESKDKAHGSAQEEYAADDSPHLEKITEQHRRALARAQRAAEKEKGLLNDEITQLRQGNEKLDRDLAQSRRAVDEQNEQTESRIMKANGEIALLKQANEKLDRDLAQSRRAVDEHKTQCESLHSRQIKANDEIMQLKQSNEKLCNELIVASSQISGNQETYEKETKALQSQFEQWKSSAQLATEQHESLRDEVVQLKRANQEHQCTIRIHEQKYEFEGLYAQGRTADAAKKLLEIETSGGELIKSNEFLSNWLAKYMSRCSQTLEKNGDDASNARKREEAVTAYAAALSLGPSNSPAVLAKWASAALTGCGAHETLQASVEFKASRFAVSRAICNALEGVGRISEAVEIFRQIPNDAQDTDASDERTEWERDFRECYVEKLVNLAEGARDSQNHEEAIQYYSLAISLDPTNLHEILLQRSDELIALDPSLYKGYEDKHTALHGMGRYNEALEAFQAMLSIFERSRDPKIRELRLRFVDATSAIREEIREAIRHLPTVLVDTDTGHLYDKKQQAAAFEELPIYDELRSAMTTALDPSRIRKEVTEFYRYVMFSHKWQLDEPTFQEIGNDSVYSLPSSPTFDKLRNFCKLVVALQYKWAWSDTCCVNQLDKGVQQESIVAMFRWYRRSSLTVVHLLGVLSEWQEPGCLWKSIWNTRGWTYQEYVASEVVQFYTEDWKPYLGLEIFNHKESPAVLSEMERATNIVTQQLVILQPGLDRAREKLYLASGRQTTREEDMAYSLFGIFGVALPVVYGEGNLAIGRLLEHILTRSAEVTLLAWTGHPGSLHSYLPASLTVYSEIVPPHVPAPIETSKMDLMVSALRSSISDLSLAIDLYEHLYDLPSLSLLAGRLRLPGIVFQLGELTRSDAESNVRVYHTTTPLLGDVEIKTTADLSDMRGLRLIHPWICPLVDLDFSFDAALFDLPTRALRLLVRLRQPFGGLLLASSGRSQYRRVATDAFIVVRVREEAPLSELLDAVHTVQVQ